MSFFPPPPRRVPSSGDDSPAASLAGYIWRMSGWHQAAVCGLAIVVAGLSMAPLELQRRIIDGALADGDLALLLWLGGLYLAVLLLQGGLKFVLRMYEGWLGESAIRYSRRHLARLHGRRIGAGERVESHEGEAVSIIGTEVDKLGGFVGESLSQPLVNLGMLVAVAGYMFVVEPMVAAVGAVFLLPQIVLVPLVQIRLNHLMAKRLYLVRALGDRVAALSGEPGTGSEPPLEDSLDPIYANRISIQLVKFALKMTINLLNGLAPLTVLMVGGWMVLQDETTLGIVVAFISGFDRLSAPLRELIVDYREIAQAGVQHRLIARWM